MADVRFIRKNGRIIPIGGKGKPSDWKTTPPRSVKRDVGTRAVSGLKTGAKVGAALGAVGGALGALAKFHSANAIGGGLKAFRGVEALKIPLAVGAFGLLGAASGAINLGILGAGAGALFGARKTQTPGRSVYAPKRNILRKSKSGV